MNGDRLGAHERAVALAVLDQEEARRRHLVVALSGAHAYGFPSPDSDLDLKAAHVAATTSLLGLEPRLAPAERSERVDGVAIDYSSNEIGQVLAGVLAGNGNYIERVLGRLILRAAPEHGELAALVRGALSRRAHRHYRGFATGMLREVTGAPEPPVKAVLYVLRTALTGARLLASGELVTDLGELAADAGFHGVDELIARKRAGEAATLPADALPGTRAAIERALARLDAAHAASPLPEEPANRAAVDAWLVALRRRELGGGA